MEVFYKPEYKSIKGKYYSKSKSSKKFKTGGIIGLYRYYCYLLKVYPKRNWQYRLSYESRQAIKQLQKYTDQITFIAQNKIYNVDDVNKVRSVKKKDLQDAYNYRNRLYYSRNKSADKDSFTEKIMGATKYINKIKNELRMCDDIERETIRINEQLKEFYKKEEKIKLLSKNKKKSSREKFTE
jgi:hypothetical protein